MAAVQTPVTDGDVQQRGGGRSQFGRGGRIGPPRRRAPSSHNVTLAANLDLTALGASGANDIWGYVSPSGREYALISLLDKLAFVEVTNPAVPVLFATIAHPNSGWGDVKVYRNHCYLTTETAGTGVQVIDLSDIDNHKVTLVNTLAEPDEAHNLAVDTESGFLYTLISHGGTGTTMCLDLTDPANPVKIGSGSMTGTVRMHDAQIVTYTSGIYAGRQILFGASESRGIAIWDVTDKSNTFLVATQTYPDTEYTHQCWLSDDRNYLYVGDELDESRSNGITTTRTLVFDVSDIPNPTLVSTFTNGLAAIDHNLYVKGGFIFESNYSSGLRIFDGNDDPTAPTEVGWYDTFPANDNANFSGTWSNFPFFPSGTVILSDRQSGLFVFDVSAATVRQAPVTSLNVVRGVITGGDVGSLSSDGAFVVKAGLTLFLGEPPINVEFEGTAPWQHASKMSVTLRGRANTPGLSQSLEMYDWAAGQFEVVDVRAAGTLAVLVQPMLTDPDRFIEQGSRLVRARVRVNQTGLTLLWPWSYFFDELSWQVNP
ncbi:MAG: choice-of-anchor B family protein [Armatimonadetes bacterium]|nr:choice-of-anchor B family protein [Armatimonadota bacterium]